MSVALSLSALKVGGVMIFADVLAAQGEVSSACAVLAYLVDHAATAAPDRDESRERLAQLRATVDAEPAWPGIELDELIDRITVETDVAYSPLIASLRGAR